MKRKGTWKTKKFHKKARTNGPLFSKGQLANSLTRQPPMFRSQPIFSERIRYALTASAMTNQQFSINTVGRMTGLVVNGTTGTTSCFRNESFRIRALRVWGAAANDTGGAPANFPSEVSLSYGTTGGTDSMAPAINFTGVSLDPSAPAMAALYPKANEFPGFWHNNVSTTVVLFQITCPLGSIIDLDYDFVLNTNSSTVSGPTISGGTAGQLFYSTINTGGGGVMTPYNVTTY